MKKPFKGVIPDSFNVAGMTYHVCHVDNKRGNSGYGEINYPKNEVTLFDKIDEAPVCKDQKVQTFWHEAVHAILSALGESNLCSDEKFVCKFSSLLNELMQTASISESDNEHEGD